MMDELRMSVKIFGYKDGPAEAVLVDGCLVTLDEEMDELVALASLSSSLASGWRETEVGDGDEFIAMLVEKLKEEEEE